MCILLIRRKIPADGLNDTALAAEIGAFQEVDQAKQKI